MKKTKRKAPNYIESLIQSALAYQQAGDLDQAERIYNQILQFQPRNAHAYNSLGNISQDRGKLDEAINYYRKVITINANVAGPFYNLASIYHEKGQLDEAIKYYRKCLRLNPAHADTYNTLGVVFLKKKKFDEASHYFQHAIRLESHFDQPYNNLGLICHEKRQFDEAVRYYRKSLQLNPNYAKAHFNLGNTLREQGQLDEAIASYEKAIELTPKFIDPYEKLGDALLKRGEGDKAIECFRRALFINPHAVGPYISLGRAMKDRGNYKEAERYFRKALKIMPDSFSCYSNLIFLMLYNTKYDSQAIFAEHLNFAQHCSGSFNPSIQTYSNNTSNDRKLKIGYISLDFRYHSVAYFFEPILMAHNRKYFDIICYSDVINPDYVTERIKSRSNKWRIITGRSDDEAEKLIRKDGIDILIDLSGLTSPRVLLFARKPSPVQVTWIGYPATTGLAAMDYKIVDNFTDPPGMTEQFYTEKLIRMPQSFLCYLPEESGPAVRDLPALQSGYITFGSFNNFAKISPMVLKLWSRILKAVPNSQLVIKTWSFSDRFTRQYVLDMFSKEGVHAERITLLPYKPSSREHLDVYNSVDIALDTFPYNGTTTTCEALWMGVPVITLAGNTHVSRVGTSLLSNIGLPELIATSPDEYISITANLAQDLNKLQSLRRSLRDMMSHSPLTDSKQFVLHLENCYKTMWTTWCNAS